MDGENFEKDIGSLTEEDLTAMTLLQKIGALFLSEDDLQTVLQMVLEAAIEITDAEMGVIELLDSESGSTRRMASRGFDSDCPIFNGGGGEQVFSALQKGERFIIEDVFRSPLLSGTPALETLATAGIGAVQMTPIVGQGGTLIGFFSTCYSSSNYPDKRKLQFLDLLARQMATNIRRLEAQEALRQSEERLRVLSEAVPQIVFVSDSEGRAEYYNSRWSDYTGQSIEEAEGLGWLAALHPEDLPRAQERWTRAVTSGTEYEVEYRIRGKDGRYRWFLSRALPYRDNTGRIVQWFGTCTDITGHKSLEETLDSAKRAAEEANRAKSEFLANMSHEIRTPMTVFMAALEHLLHIDSDPEHLELLEMANHAAQRLHVLIDDVLDFSRIEARKVDIDEEPFDLADCVCKAAEMMAIKAREKNLLLHAEISPEIPSEILGDKNRLAQVLINLIGNAIKFTNEGEVKVSVQLVEDKLHFAVSDTGIGIPEEKRHFLFQTFRQIDSSLTRKYGGAGLGLAISKGLVELMGGEIGVRERNGPGSVFFFTLPLKKVQKPRFERAPESKTASSPQLCALSVLLAEDDPLVSDVIQKLLDRRGWMTETAQTGVEAVEKWRSGSFDVILMDLHMPELNGVEAARRIREMEKELGRHTCIVGLTADARRETRNQCRIANLDGYLTKPVRMDDLYEVIEKCFSDRGRSLRQSAERL